MSGGRAIRLRGCRMHALVVPNISGLSLQITDACNLACSYCYFREKEPRSLSAAMVDGALNLLERESGDSPSWGINLFGGEPTLFPERIASVTAQATDRAARLGKTVNFSMTTNGTRFDDAMLALTRRYRISTQLSLDGNEAAHDTYRVHHNGRGSFQDIVANLPRLKQAPGFSVRMTISVRMLPHLSASMSDLIDLGIDSIAASVVAEDDWTEDAYDLFADEWLKVGALVVSHGLRGRRLRIKDLSADSGIEAQCKPVRGFGCGAATSFLFVDAKGDLYPCHRYPGYFNKSPDVRLGSVFTGLDAERRAYYVEANRSTAKKGCASFIHPDRTGGSCSQCGIQSACGGACMAINHNATGDPTRPPPVLGRIKQIMLAVQERIDTLSELRVSKEIENVR